MNECECEWIWMNMNIIMNIRIYKDILLLFFFYFLYHGTKGKIPPSNWEENYIKHMTEKKSKKIIDQSAAQVITIQHTWDRAWQ